MKTSRSKFALVLEFLKPVTPIIRMGYKTFSHRQTPFNAAMSYNLAHAVSGEYPEYSLKYSNIKLSIGKLDPIGKVRMMSENGVLAITWDFSPQSFEDERIFVCVINEEDEEAVMVENGEIRKSCGQIVYIPKEWIGRNVHVYAGFSRLDDVSDSQYLGCIEIAYKY
jgi:hypothetical protein